MVFLFIGGSSRRKNIIVGGISMDNKSVIKKDIKINDMTIKVIKKNISTSKMVKNGVISESDAEMDKRARAAVSMAKKQAKVCNKPIALYDKKQKKPYMLNSAGERINFG